MKKYTLIAILVIGLIGLLNISSCKRTVVDDPAVTGPAGFRIVLSLTANPSTLYVPSDLPETSSLITAVARNNDGSPASNKEVVFQLGEKGSDYGFFEGYVITDSRTTNANGVAQITYFLPSNFYSRKGDTQVEIKAVLQDDGRLDHHPLSHIMDSVPIRIIPHTKKEMVMITGWVFEDMINMVGLQDVVISAVGDGGGPYDSTMTVSRASGSWEVYVPWYWTGTIAASRTGYAFSPTSYIITTPLIADVHDRNFIGTATVAPTLTADVTTISALYQGNPTFTVTVQNSTTADPITCQVSSNASWITVSNITNGGVTTFQFDITIDDQLSSGDPARTGTVTILATIPAVGVSGSPVTITVDQDPYP